MDPIPFARRPAAHAGVLLGILAILAVVEIALEVRAHARGYDTLVLGHASTADTTHSTYPFRSAPVDSAKGPGIPRLWIAGASQARDAYHPLAEIFPSLLIDNLNAQGIHCDLINGSQDGTGIEGNLALLEKFAPRYRPDWVILYQASYEIQTLSASSFGPRKGAGPGGKAPGEWHRGMLDGVTAFLEATSLFAYLQTEVRTRLMAAKPLYDSLPPSAEKEYRDRLGRFIAYCRTHGATPVLTTFSARYGRSDSAAFDDELFRSQLRYDPFLSRHGWLWTIDRFNSINREVASAEGLPVLDVATAMTGRKECFRDFSHFTAAGHKRMAQALASGLSHLLRPKTVAGAAP